MFDRLSRAATRTAESVDLSRRGFLGRLGGAALAAAGAVGGLLAPAGEARAGKSNVVYDCYYKCPGTDIRVQLCGGCPDHQFYGCNRIIQNKTSVPC